MKKIQNVIGLLIVSSTLLALNFHETVNAQLPGTKRAHLQQTDLSIPGREVVQARISLDSGVSAPRHSHPGEEIIYVIEGTLEYELEGHPPVKLKAGDVLYVPAGTIHAAKNVGSENGAELATYIVEKGKPLLVMAGE